jgi:hypothetical protein
LIPIEKQKTKNIVENITGIGTHLELMSGMSLFNKISMIERRELMEVITIPRSEYEKLLRDSELLSCLEACGVDNWSGWDMAMQMFSEED